MDKHEYAAAAIRGDDAALLQRIDMDKQKMYGIAYSYMRNESDALEAMQETVYRVWMKRHTLRDERLFSTWMIRILIRVCMDERRKQKRELLSVDERKQQEGVVHPDNTEERLDMARQIAELPPKYRMVVILKYYRDMTITDIAELLEKPDGTIRTWLNKALRLLRSMRIERKEGVPHERGSKQGI